MKKYRVKLSASNHKQLLELVRKGKATARIINRARILLLAHADKTDEEIAAALQISVLTIHYSSFAYFLRLLGINHWVWARAHDRGFRERASSLKAVSVNPTTG